MALSEKGRYARQWRKRNPDKVKRYRDTSGTAYRYRIRQEVLTYYGRGKLACMHCEFADARALVLDHIKGDGWKERRKRDTNSLGFLLSLRREGYPKGYQTLCANCNVIKARVHGEYAHRTPHLIRLGH